MSEIVVWSRLCLMLSVADAHRLGLTPCIAADTHTHDVPLLSDPSHLVQLLPNSMICQLML